MTQDAPLRRLRATEAELFARRAGSPDAVEAAARALRHACGDPPPADLLAVARAIATAVEAHGQSFPPGAEPAYHDRHHQAEAMLAAGLLAGAAREAGLLSAREAGLCVLAMAGHDLGHDGSAGLPPGRLERAAANATAALTEALAPEERAAITRLILLTDPAHPPPSDLPGMLVREADLFASLLPDLGWQLSLALARERRAAGIEGAEAVATHAGRLALLRMLPGSTPPAASLGLEAMRRIQHDALCLAGGRPDPDEAAAGLDAMAPEDAMQRWASALLALDLPGRPS